MKQVFCWGLLAYNFRDRRSYAAVVANAPVRQSASDPAHTNVSGSILGSALTLANQCQEPVFKHEVTMCNVDRNIKVLNTVPSECTPHTRSFHKRSVGQESAHTSGQVLLLHDRFTVLSDDTYMQDTHSTFDMSGSDSDQHLQLDNKVSTVANTRVGHANTNSTSRYFMHSASHSFQDVFQKSCVQLENKFGCLPLSPILLYTGPPKHHQVIPDVLQAHRFIRESGLPNFWGLRIPPKTQLNIPAWCFTYKIILINNCWT